MRDYYTFYQNINTATYLFGIPIGGVAGFAGKMFAGTAETAFCGVVAATATTKVASRALTELVIGREDRNYEQLGSVFVELMITGAVSVITGLALAILFPTAPYLAAVPFVYGETETVIVALAAWLFASDLPTPVPEATEPGGGERFLWPVFSQRQDQGRGDY